MGRYCSNCPLNGKGSDECISCNSVSAEYSNPHGRYLFDGYQPPQPDVSGSEQVTSLPDEVEDTIRKFLFRLFDLTPNELLCLQAIMRGKDLTAFGKDMERLS